MHLSRWRDQVGGSQLECSLSLAHLWGCAKLYLYKASIKWCLEGECNVCLSFIAMVFKLDSKSQHTPCIVITMLSA